MVRKFLLPVLAGCLLVFAIGFVVKAQQSPPELPPPIMPASSPFPDTVAGAGIVEAQTENISVGSALPGVVTEVLVRVGTKVHKSDPLFRLDDRQLRAELHYREASLAAAEAQLARLQSQPRPEELPSSEARVHEAEANVIDQKDQLKRTLALRPGGAVAEEERVRREMAYRVAKEQLARARADYNLLKAGAWEPDKAVARAAVTQAKAQIEQTRTDLDRLVVRALVDGEVLQVNVRPGEFVGAPPSQALIILGSVNRLHVRVDIDEHDIPRFRRGAPARAVLRGEPAREFRLSFVRVEPYVVPKKSLTGDNTERVDTRVLQVIYAVEGEAPDLYVGQQVDVFIEVAKAERAGHESTATQRADTLGRGKVQKAKARPRAQDQG
jgi:multidrug resistance efflux pump